MRSFLAAIDPSAAEPQTEFDAAIAEAEIQAWYAAVNIKDYVRMFRTGYGLATGIYGDPYATYLDGIDDTTIGDQLAQKVDALKESGLLCIIVPKPDLDAIFPSPISRIENETSAIGSSDQNHLREAFGIKFLQQMHSGGFRDVAQIGAQGYLDQVPDELELFSYCAPDGTKSFISTEGFVGTGRDLEPDFERPLSQRGGGLREFLRKNHEYVVPGIMAQLEFLEMHQERFTFDDKDLLGYRPLDLSESGISVAWDGYTDPSQNT